MDATRGGYFHLLNQEPDETSDVATFLGSRHHFPMYDLGGGIRFQPVWGQGMLLNWVYFEPDCQLPDHQHPEEQLGTIIEGEMELVVDGVARSMRRGDVYVIPPGVVHGGRTSSQPCVALDIFAPPRADFADLIARATRVPTVSDDAVSQPRPGSS